MSDSALFIGLVASLHSSGMIQLGKLANPLTGKAERDLDAVRQTIDLLDVIQQKTRGNLTDGETRFLERALFELRMNFVEESRHPASAVDDKPGAASGENPANHPPDA
jgi:hypothetical protein